MSTGPAWRGTLRPPLPPEPGSLAYQALADQLAAAVNEVTQHAAHLTHEGALLLDASGPWAEALHASVAPILGRSRRRAICAHIAHHSGPQPLYVITPQFLICRACLDVFERRPAASLDCHRCHRCARPSVPPLRTVIAQRGQVLAIGHLCPPCLFAERLHHTTAPHGDPQ